MQNSINFVYSETSDRLPDLQGALNLLKTNNKVVTSDLENKSYSLIDEPKKTLGCAEFLKMSYFLFYLQFFQVIVNCHQSSKMKSYLL